MSSDVAETVCHPKLMMIVGEGANVEMKHSLVSLSTAKAIIQASDNAIPISILDTAFEAAMVSAGQSQSPAPVMTLTDVSETSKIQPMRPQATSVALEDLASLMNTNFRILLRANARMKHTAAHILSGKSLRLCCGPLMEMPKKLQEHSLL